jgi:hypothetical protein
MVKPGSGSGFAVNPFRDEIDTVAMTNGIDCCTVHCIEFL